MEGQDDLCNTQKEYWNGTSAATVLKVKDKLAALWPFLGICAEVIVLCAIILIYEKNRNRMAVEESESDDSSDENTSYHRDNPIRQRK